MGKAFDVVHRVINSQPAEENRIPFEDEQSASEATHPLKRRPRVEVAFFYILLFAVFCIMGAAFLSPSLISSFISKPKQASSPAPNNSPVQGFAIDKKATKEDPAAKSIGKASPSPSPTTTSSPSPTQPTVQATQTAKIQIVNGTTRAGAAATLRDQLSAKGISVASIGNYQKRTVKKTTIYYDAGYKTAAEQVQAVSGGLLFELPSSTGSYDIVVIIGASS